jgi:hypothetical protein
MIRMLISTDNDCWRPQVLCQSDNKMMTPGKVQQKAISDKVTKKGVVQKTN